MANRRTVLRSRLSSGAIAEIGLLPDLEVVGAAACGVPAAIQTQRPERGWIRAAVGDRFVLRRVLYDGVDKFCHLST